MQQAELRSLVDGLKADISKPAKLDRKTVADRANMANLAALEMLTETVAEKNTMPFKDKASDLHSLSKELGEITGFIEELGERSKNA
ncbi:MULTISPECIES: hypothetical protein [Sneathiella]|jgi:hypothetical protein|uniref:hypothetical protein n=1 Tax=Sneathiella TaxID=510690 RepID=UPI00146E2E3F|nr:hypothetical protein [Sneathiella aquimaris]